MPHYDDRGAFEDIIYKATQNAIRDARSTWAIAGIVTRWVTRSAARRVKRALKRIKD